MLSLGGSVLGFSEAASSSTAKGETVGDTVHTVSCYADIIAMRHPKEGAPSPPLRSARCPSSTPATAATTTPPRPLTDLLTNPPGEGPAWGASPIGFCGDLKFGPHGSTPW